MFGTMLAAIRAFYAHSFWHYPEADTRYGLGYVLSYSGRTWLSGANQLWIDVPGQVNAALLDDAVRFFRPYQAEWSVFTLPKAQPGLQERLLHLGAYTRWSSPLMLLDGPPARVRPLPPVTVQAVQGEALRRAAHRIIAEAFHMHPEVSPRMVRAEDEADSEIHHAIALVDGIPAGVASLSLKGQIASIWNVGTRRRFRRRGVAYALMHDLLEKAQLAQCPRSILLASSMGRPLYETLGYQTIAQVYYMGVAAH